MITKKKNPLPRKTGCILVGADSCDPQLVRFKFSAFKKITNYRFFCSHNFSICSSPKNTVECLMKLG